MSQNIPPFSMKNAFFNTVNYLQDVSNHVFEVFSRLLWALPSKGINITFLRNTSAEIVS